jgi:hypothetical protein
LSGFDLSYAVQMIAFESSQLTRRVQVAVIMHSPVEAEHSLSKSKDPLVFKVVDNCSAPCAQTQGMASLLIPVSA